MTATVRTKWPNGYWVDELIPIKVKTLLEDEGVGELESFRKWFGPRLGQFRFAREIQEKFVPRKDEHVAALLRVARCLGDAADSVQGLSPLTGALLRARGELEEIAEMPTLLRAFVEQAQLLSVLANATARDYKAIPAREGPKPKTIYHDLFAEVASKLGELGLTDESARSLAQRILRACGLDVPREERAQRKVVAKTRARRAHP